MTDNLFNEFQNDFKDFTEYNKPNNQNSISFMPNEQSISVFNEGTEESVRSLQGDDAPAVDLSKITEGFSANTSDNSILSGNQIDVSKFNLYKKQLKKFGKLSNLDFDKMDDEQKTFLFINFFKFIADEYFNQYGIKLETDEECMTFGAILLAANKEFAKKLREYVKQYVFYVKQLWDQKKLEQKRLKPLMAEAMVLIKFLKSNPSNKATRAFIGGGGGRTATGVVGLVSPKMNADVYKRMQAYDGIQKFLGVNNRLSGNKAKRIDPIVSFNKMGYSTIAEQFKPDNFYSLDKNDIINLLNNLTSEYCRQCNATPPLVSAGQFLPCEENGKVTYGANYPSTNTVVFNEDVINKGLNKFKDSKDPRFPLRLMQTALHEAHHTIQNESRTNEERNNTDMLGAKNYLEYAKNADEVDARRTAIKMLEKMKEEGLLDKSIGKEVEKLKQEEASLQEKIKETTWIE